MLTHWLKLCSGLQNKDTFMPVHNSPVTGSNPVGPTIISGHVGIGRQTRFKICWSSLRPGSNPGARTII